MGQFGGTKRRVKIEQLSGDERSEVAEQAAGHRISGLPAQDRPRDPGAGYPSV
jgi:hypothetical protein